MNRYIGLYKGKRHEIFAKTSYEAQQVLAKELKVKKRYEISIYLCEKDGKEVTQSITS